MAAGTLFLTILIVSASALAYEILLMRLFSIVQWHHFAYMVISLALLGYGISGTFITIFRKHIFRYFPIFYIVNLLLFATTAPTAFIIAQYFPFNAQEMLWDFEALLWLLAYFTLFSLPFFFAANAVGLALSYYKQEISRLYAADMIGAGIGSLIILALFFRFHPFTILLIISAAGFFSAALAVFSFKMDRRQLLLPLILMLLPFSIPKEFRQIRPSPYKDLSQILKIKGTRIAAEETGAFGIVTVVESPDIPFRYAPGVSLHNQTEPPQQLAIFVNGEWAGVITRYTGDKKALQYLDYLTSAVAYHVSKPEHVLIIGAGGGMDVLQTLYFSANTIDAIEPDRTIMHLVKERYGDFSGHIYNNPRVRVHIDDARGYIIRTKDNYDLIQFAFSGASSGASSGLSALSENYLYTIEAFRNYLSHLRPDGYLSLTQRINLPPRASLKLFATAIEALKAEGATSPAQQLLMLRGWQTTTLLVKNGIVTPKEITALERFCESRGFDLVYYDSMPFSKANRYNVLDRPIFHTSVKSLLQEPDFFARYRFDIRPTTDDRPYFHHFFKWETFSEILSLRGAGGLYLMEWGYVVLIVTLLLAIILSFFLILLPLSALRLKTAKSWEKIRVLFYFFALGTGFMFLEIAFMQKFILFLSDPVFSAAVVLSTFLVFAGMGSRYTHRLIEKLGDRKTLTLALAAILFLSLLDLVLLNLFYGKFIALPFVAKVSLTIVTLAPLAFAMGMPFPLALSFLANTNAPLIPWAWGINGCASVISAIVATLLAIDFGLTAVILSALLFYTGARFVFPFKQ